MGKETKKVRVALSLDAEGVKLYKQDARDMGLSLSQYVELLLISGSRRFGEEAVRANEALQFFRDRAWLDDGPVDLVQKAAADEYLAKARGREG